jgi:cytochrome c oxidase subunit 1
MHFAGFAGNPRRYADFTTFDFLAQSMPLQRWITDSAFCLAAVQLIFLWNLAKSIGWGKPAPANPWEATSLEWAEGEGAVVRGPYEYSPSGAERDYLMQNDESRGY